MNLKVFKIKAMFELRERVFVFESNNLLPNKKVCVFIYNHCFLGCFGGCVYLHWIYSSADKNEKLLNYSDHNYKVDLNNIFLFLIYCFVFEIAFEIMVT